MNVIVVSRTTPLLRAVNYFTHGKKLQAKQTNISFSNIFLRIIEIKFIKQR